MGAADQLRFLLADAFRAADWQLEGLDDDSCFSEPVPHSWSVRPRAEATAGWGTGGFVCEDPWPRPVPLPTTTIAWRIAHLAAWTDIYRNWTFGPADLHLTRLEVPGTAEELAAWLRRSQGAFISDVDRLTDLDLDERRPAHYGPLLPIWYLVQTIAGEHVHHGAEVGVLRDLAAGVGRAQREPPLP
jgi:hypothetical protein